MSMIGNTPGVSSQRTVLEEVVTGSPKSNFVPQGGYVIGYVDVLVNGTEIDSSDFTAADGVNINLAVAAAVGDTVKVKAWLPRGLSDGYLKTEADALLATKLPLAGGQLTGSVGFGVAVVSGARGNTQHLAGGSIRSEHYANNNTQMKVMGNVYEAADTSYKRIYAEPSSMYSQNAGIHYWSSGVTGAAGADAALANTMLLDIAGNLSPQGNLVLASGKGIDFSANSNAGGMTGEVLNDYEEGTWTPTILGSITNPTITSNVSSASYTKVGNLVTLNFYLQGARSGGSGDFVLTGLPFAIAVQNNFNGGALIGYNCAFTGLQCIWRARSTTQVGILGSANNAGGWGFQTVGALDTGTFALTGSISYQTS